ncbi:SirB2 family protein [Pasteurella multocida]|uniref:SirB2 family protein n=1 Tax=Pasteurella multocida TaxID=747 RepID=UPI0039FBF147
MAYYLIYLHIACAFLSLSLFIIRGMMQLTGKNWRDRKVLKILPHLSDTLLFCSGIELFLLFQQSVTTWFIYKMLFIALYIAVATIFFSRKRLTSPFSQKKNRFYFITALIFFLSTMVIAYLK